MIRQLSGLLLYTCFAPAAAAATYWASQVYAGDQTACAVLEGTKLKCWGDPADERLPAQWGDDPGEMGLHLASIDIGDTVKSVAVSSHICAVLNSGTLKCWGKNNHGQCGAGHSDDVPISSAVTVDLGSGRFATSVAVGVLHTCAILDDSTLKCWGSNVHGQLGQTHLNHVGNTAGQMGDNLVPVNLGSSRTAVQVVAGSAFTCALLDNGSVKCWGRNNYGQLGASLSSSPWQGHGDAMGDELWPIYLGWGRTAKRITANYYHACAILDDDSAKCWGRNNYGQLGQGDTNDVGQGTLNMTSLSPIELGQAVRDVSAGEFHTCAVLFDQSLKCWGANSNGQLGLEDRVQRGGSSSDMTNLPTVDLGTGLSAEMVSCSLGDFTCALLNDDSVKCWGRNSNGQLGQGDTADRGDDPGEMGDNLLPVDLALPFTITITSTTSTSRSMTSFSTSSTSSTHTHFTTTRSATVTTTRSATVTTTPRATVTTAPSTSATTTRSTTVTTTPSTTATTTGSATVTTTPRAAVTTAPSTSATTTRSTTVTTTQSATVTTTPSNAFGETTGTTALSVTAAMTTTSGNQTLNHGNDSNETDISTTQNQIYQDPVSSTSSTVASTPMVARLVLTVDEFEALEQERKAQAVEAVQELQTAEAEAVSQLLDEIVLDNESTMGVLGQASRNIGGGVMKMVVVAPEAFVESTANVTISGEPGGASADVPAEVAQLASQLAGASGGPILMTLTELSDEVASKIRTDDARAMAQAQAQQGRRLASSLKTAPISLKIRASQGEELRIAGLTQPIVFRLPVDEDTSNLPFCAFWDEELSVWSTEGVTTLPSTIPGEVLCSTTHLSIFGGVFEILAGDIAQVLRCSTASMIFSAEGLGNLFKSEWLWQGPSLVVFSLLLLFLLSFLLSLKLDRRHKRYFPEKDREVILWPLKEPAEEEVGQLDDEEQQKTKPSSCKETIQSGCEWLLWFVGLFFGYENLAEVLKELFPNAAVGVVDRCISQIHAHKTGTSRDSLDAVADITKVLTEEKRIDSSEPTHSVKAKRQSLTEREIKGQLDWAVDTFLSSSWFTRVRLLFPAVHPWVENTRISVFTSHATRTILIIMKLISAGAASALFFSSAAQTPDSDPDCEPPEEFLREMVQNAIVGIFTAFIGDIVIFILFFVQLRQPKPEVEWTEELKEKYRRKWRCRRVVFWTVATLHIGICLLYCLSFLANVTVADAAEWLESCAITLLQDLVILPLLMAFALASLATLAVLCSRKVQRSHWIPEHDEESQDELQCVSLDILWEGDHWCFSNIEANEGNEVKEVKVEDCKDAEPTVTTTGSDFGDSNADFPITEVSV